MSMGYIKNGEYVQVAGNAEPSGELVVGASTVRKGTVTTRVPSPNPGFIDILITFDTPMPNADYEVDITFLRYHLTWFFIKDKGASGFYIRINTNGLSGGSDGPSFTYTAFKLIEKEDIQDLTDNVEAIDNKISELATSTNKLVSKSEMNDSLAPIIAKIPANASTANKMVTVAETGNVASLQTANKNLTGAVNEVRAAVIQQNGQMTPFVNGGNHTMIDGLGNAVNIGRILEGGNNIKLAWSDNAYLCVIVDQTVVAAIRGGDIFHA